MKTFPSRHSVPPLLRRSLPLLLVAALLSPSAGASVKILYGGSPAGGSPAGGVTPGTVQPLITVPPAGGATAAPAQETATEQAASTPPQDNVPAYNNGQQQAPQNLTLPPLPEPQAYQNDTNGVLPLTPGQIRQLREAIGQQRQAEESPLSPAMPRLETINAHIGTGAPPAISVQQGYVSTINIVDAYGRPWPIVRYSLGNPTAFHAAVASNSVSISDLQPYAQSNIALYLLGETTPLMVALVPGAQGPSGGGVVDYSVRIRVDASIPGQPLPVGGMAGGANYTNVLLSVVQGVSPTGAGGLRVMGDPARIRAWEWDGPRGPRLLLRAPATVVAPAWIATMKGPAGIHAWVLPDVRVITVSEDGRIRQIVLRKHDWKNAAKLERTDD